WNLLWGRGVARNDGTETMARGERFCECERGICLSAIGARHDADRVEARSERHGVGEGGELTEVGEHDVGVASGGAVRFVGHDAATWHRSKCCAYGGVEGGGWG